MAFGEHLENLVTDTLVAHLVNLRAQFENGAEGSFVNAVAKAGGEAHRPQHAQLVFHEALAGIADGANDAALQVFVSAYVVEHLA